MRKGEFEPDSAFEKVLKGQPAAVERTREKTPARNNRNNHAPTQECRAGKET